MFKCLNCSYCRVGTLWVLFLFFFLTHFLGGTVLRFPEEAGGTVKKYPGNYVITDNVYSFIYGGVWPNTISILHIGGGGLSRRVAHIDYHLNIQGSEKYSIAMR